jgi:hypothetical protein
MICDPLKAEAHRRGFAAAFKRSDVFGKLTIVNCDITTKDQRSVPVRVSVRIVPTNGELYAVARIDREASIVEYGEPAAERGASEQSEKR